MRVSRRDMLAGVAGTAMLGGCVSIPGMAAKAPKLVYLGQAKLFSFDPEGGAPVTLVDDTPKDGSRATGVNDGVAVHAATGQIFWTNMGRATERDGYIMRCERDGSKVTTIVAPGGTFTPKQLKIDEAGAKLYWSDREGMAIQRCNLDGSALETLVVTGDPETHKGDQSRWCVGMAVDPARGDIYWTQKGGDDAGQGVIRRCRIPTPAEISTGRTPYVETLFWRLPEPIDLDLDLATRTMYWTDRGDNTLSRAPMDPPANWDTVARTDRTILLHDLGEAIGVALDLPRKRLAWTNLEGTVGVSTLDGSSKQVLLTKQGMLTGICWA